MYADWFKISMITSFVLMFLVASARAETYQEFVIQNTKPAAEVSIGGPPAANPLASGPRSGKDVYEAGCSFCHATGAAGSPKIGNKAAWAPRIAQGIDVLINHAMHGFNTMPPKGMCPTCTQDEIAAAVHYMVDQSK